MNILETRPFKNRIILKERCIKEEGSLVFGTHLLDEGEQVCEDWHSEAECAECS